LAEVVLQTVRATAAACAITFQETDIAAVGLANQRHGVPWARPDADAIARDKSRQRRHLAAHGLPAPAFLEVRDPAEALDRLASETPDAWPVIVKPTHAAGSSHVRLARCREDAAEALNDIRALADSRLHNFYDGVPEVWALIEEYLPGDEVTCDGVVIDGTFHLGGIHTKHLGEEPWFEEDLYTLPFTDQDAEVQIVAIASGLAQTLGVQHCLLNVELRRDSSGVFRVVEFSTRISGGHVYRNVLDVHAVDLVELFLQAVLGDPVAAGDRARHRDPGRMATCIRMVYKTGLVVTNNAGAAWADPQFRAYYPLAGPGSEVASAPAGFDICGLLSVRGHFVPDHHPRDIHEAARRIEHLLALEVDEDESARRLYVV
jgi:biotin carboxylase